MRVGFDITPITSRRTGVGTYCFQLLRHLLALEENFQITGFSSGWGRLALGPLAGKIARRHIPIPTRLLYQLWSATGRPKIDRLLGNIDLYHATNFFLPPVARARRVLTIHDLSFLVMPEYSSPAIVGPFSRGMRQFAAGADAILAYSQSTKNDIVRLLGIPSEKITVAPIAADPALAPIAKEAAAAHLQQTYGISRPFFLFVGTLEPRKNVAGVVRAFAQLAGEFPHNLVLIGPAGWNSEAIFQSIAQCGVPDRTIRPGFVPAEDLSAFYSAAAALLFPTHYEGFGLPLLEAMTCGCPIVTSDNSSVREVAGDAALYAPCDDIGAIAAAARRVVEDSPSRETMIKSGYAQARKFSWADCAQATFDVYRRLLGA